MLGSGSFISSARSSATIDASYFILHVSASSESLSSFKTTRMNSEKFGKTRLIAPKINKRHHHKALTSVVSYQTVFLFPLSCPELLHTTKYNVRIRNLNHTFAIVACICRSMTIKSLVPCKPNSRAFYGIFRRRCKLWLG